MLRELNDQYLREDAELAPYATHNSSSRGRRHPEEPHPLRTDFQRDRDRVLHSRSFRRLEYKTQVFLNGAGDHLRTRLTHTIEVAAITRTIARALCLNEDLAETIALAHDLGHTPFGHAGETAMNELMAGYGGFDHNDQALRVLELLERKYPDYDGLNLTWEVRSGLVKHRADGKITEIDGVRLAPSPSLESQAADLADDLTYYGHDVDDGLDAGLLDEEMLRTCEIWNRAVEKAGKRGMDIVDGDEKSRGYVVRCLIDMMVENAVLTSEANLTLLGIDDAEKACALGKRMVSFDAEFQTMTDDLRAFLFENLYYHPGIASVNNGAVDKMRTLFPAYVEHPEWMGESACSRIESDGLYRVVADYISGMTDRFALLEYERRCG